MTDIKFYHNAPDRLAAACSIAAKALLRQHKIMVYAPDTVVARRYDAMLWSLRSTSFLPHVRKSSPLAARTPIVIADDLEAPASIDILINLDGEPPPGFSRFAMVVEIVSLNGEERASGRRRWHFYKEHGYPIQAFDLAKAGAE